MEVTIPLSAALKLSIDSEVQPTKGFLPKKENQVILTVRIVVRKRNSVVGFLFVDWRGKNLMIDVQLHAV